MVKSIGLQQGLLQTNSIERIQQVQQQHPDTQQRYFEIEMEREKKRAKEKVENMEKPEQMRIKADDRKKDEHKSSFKGSDAKDETVLDGGETDAGFDTGGTIDVKV